MSGIRPSGSDRAKTRITRPRPRERTAMTIRLQHETATVSELRGATCSAFRAIEDSNTGFLGPLYLEASGTWHRFYLDAGLLFWQEGSEPEPEDDLLDGERYIDLAASLGVVGQGLADIEMRDSQLRVEFQNGARLRLEHGPRGDGTSIIERRAAGSGEAGA
jgi:hypothetical protein